ncbi:BapA/Bap/LapF family prefix-like domain-containing protein, partial [Halomonas sp. AOP43-A1-21]
MANQAIVITEKANGNVTQQQANDVIALQSPSAVKISVGPEEIASFNQSGMNLVIVLKSGEQIVIADFFVVTDDVRSELILEDSNGVLWLGQYQSPWSHFAFAEINEEGLVAAGDVSPWVFALGGLGVLGAAIAASDSSSSDSNPPDNEEPGAGDGIDDGDEPDAGDPMDPDDGDADADADGDADADADADGDADGDADADADGDADGDADADADADGDADADADADGDADADADADGDADADADGDADADADADADGDADGDADADADADGDADADADGDADGDADADADADGDADADADADGDADADADGDADGDADADADADGDVTAPIAPALALANDTGADDNDGITSDGTVNVGNLEPDATWEYSLDGGDTWIEGVGESFELPDGTYADGDVIAR